MEDQRVSEQRSQLTRQFSCAVMSSLVASGPVSLSSSDIKHNTQSGRLLEDISVPSTAEPFGAPRYEYLTRVHLAFSFHFPVSLYVSPRPCRADTVHKPLPPDPPLPGPGCVQLPGLSYWGPGGRLLLLSAPPVYNL